MKDLNAWIEFQPNPKVPRLFRSALISEKIDGTSSCVIVQPDGTVQAGSKNRLLTLEQDNFGFCAWVKQHEDELRALGTGLHRGEWWGSGIQRAYGLKNGERHFSLFNVSRWNRQIWEENEDARVLHEVRLIAGAKRRAGEWPEGQLPQVTRREFVPPPPCCEVVPVLSRGVFSSTCVNDCLSRLEGQGSVAMPGYDRPEGVVVFHEASGTFFKVTLENDEQSKGEQWTH
jgi:hypothetical protein